MVERKRIRRVLLCCAAVLFGCQSAQDGTEPGAQQIGEAVSLPELTPLGEEPELEGTGQALVEELLCKPCKTSADCGGAPNYCLRRSDGVRFCGGDCRRSSCPSGFSCSRLSFGIYQCVPKQNDCASAAPDAGPAPDASTPDASTPDASAADASADAGVPDAAPPSDPALVPNTPQCAAAASWDPAWTAFEDEVLRLSNLQRQAGAVCGGASYPPVPALTVDPALRCAARLHAKDMQDRDYFSHTTPDGVTFDQRITQAGYRWRTIGENIAAGYRTPQAVVQGWMQSTGHCQNVMNGTFTQLGVGFYDDYRWTQDFGKPF
jgi:uncharacterized protein YkwD